MWAQGNIKLNTHRHLYSSLGVMRSPLRMNTEASSKQTYTPGNAMSNGRVLVAPLTENARWQAARRSPSFPAYYTIWSIYYFNSRYCQSAGLLEIQLTLNTQHQKILWSLYVQKISSSNDISLVGINNVPC